MIKNRLSIIQDYLFPPICLLCGEAGFNSQDICHACFDELQRNINGCYRCATMLNTMSMMPQLCGRCLTHSPVFDETHAPFIYQTCIRYLIINLKYNRHYKNARLLGYLLATYLQKTAEMPDLILPVPLHKQRFRERGFNQSIEIAKNLSKQLNIPIDTSACIRKINTPQQMGLSEKQRYENIKNAFRVKKSFKKQHIAIVDDVMTTGSTVNELAKVLKKGGVSRVDIWVCARAS